MHITASLVLSAMVSSFLYTFMLMNFQSIKLNENIKKVTLLFAILTFSIGSGAILLSGISKIGALYIVVTVFNYLIFNKNLKRASIYSLVTYAILIISEIVSVVTLMVIMKIEINMAIINEYNIILHMMIIAISLIFLNVALFVFKKIQFNNYVDGSEKHKTILYLGLNLLILTGFWIYIASDAAEIGNQVYNLIMILVLLSTNIALVLFQSNLSVKEKLIKSISEEKRKREMYIEVMEELMDNIKSFKHDYANSIHTLTGYMLENDNDGALCYLKSLSNLNEDEKILQYYELKYLKEPGLKGLIISKVSDMIKKDLDFTISIDQSNKLSERKIDMLDLSRVIGILIDNAIEASEQSEDKKVFINILENRCSTEIVISNSFLGNVDIMSLSLSGYSSKGKDRGIGLYNANQILSKYENINMFTNVNGNMFFQKIELLF